MKNKERVLWQEITIRVMNVIIVILCIVLLLVVANCVQSTINAFNPPYKESSFRYYVEHNEFAYLVSKYYRNVAEGDDSAKMKEYYGVAEYFEAASYYKAFLEAGDTVRAERELKRMEEAAGKMGGWEMTKAVIHEQLGLDK